ncbi:exodeoxyribonuclease 7 small subunit [Sporomusaceae bacterium FL31]|nr:exodeoxyribonuclease 7 small subunit [Sporomusaceae bacterium FL31]GCE33296.1 exodeoxyribonuclease 7 small subunit [Sporomusaceae bacterium]
MKKKSIQAAQISFEEALSKLEEIVKQLEKGDATLENLLEKFSEGVELSQLCLTKLNAAEKAVDVILLQEENQLTERPLILREEE